MELPTYPKDSTAYQVLYSLNERGLATKNDPVEAEGLDKDGEPLFGWVFRFNSPFRKLADSESFALTIQDELGEKGTYFDFVSKETGSLYDLAEWLGIAIERDKKPTKAYASLREYAKEHGSTEKVFLAAGFYEETFFCNIRNENRLAITFPTATGKRSRYLDGLKPKYHSPYKYQPCWYGLDRAIKLAESNQLPLMFVNGEPSVVVCQALGFPAFCLTGGSEKKILKQRFLDILKEKYPEGVIWIILDCDKAGRAAAPALAAQLRKHGYESMHLDLDGSIGYDIADMCRDVADPLGRLQALAALAKSITADPEPEKALDFEMQSDALHPLTIERASLGIALFHSDIAKKAARWGDHLYSHKMFAAIASIIARLEMVTLESVWQECQNRGIAQITFEELKKMQSEGLNKEPWAFYLETLIDAAERRTMLQTAFRLQTMARDPQCTIGDMHLAMSYSKHVTKQRSTQMTSNMNALDLLWQHMSNPSSGVKTNIAPIDQAVDSIDQGEMFVIGGRPGGGKTQLSIQIAMEMALSGQPILFFTQEVPVYQMIARQVVCGMHSPSVARKFPSLKWYNTDIPYNVFIKKGELLDRYPMIYEALSEFTTVLTSLPIQWVFGRRTINDIELMVHEHYETVQQPAVVVVDYIQYMEWPKGAADERIAIAKNMQSLKQISEDFEKVHHMQVLSQMRRGADNNKATDEMLMSDIAGSSVIENSATTMLMLPTKSDEQGQSWVGVPKARNGQTGSFPLTWNKRWGIFS